MSSVTATCNEEDLNVHHEEIPTAFSQEFEEILDDLKLINRSKEPIFQSLFIDKMPKWRTLHYLLTLHHIKNAVKAIDEACPLLMMLGPIKESPKQTYIHFIKKLRASLSHLSMEHSLKEVCYKFYTSNDLHVFCKKLIQLMKKSVPVEAINDDIFTRLYQTRKQIVEAPKFLKTSFFHSICQFMVGQFHLNYDPQIQENIPYKLFEIPIKEKAIQVIRMGTPTQENYLAPFTQKAQVNNEFMGFIEFLAKINKKHIYFNFQNKIPTWWGRNEAPRCRALETFASHYPQTLYFITLPKNTLFYHQEGIFETLDDAASFKTNFLDEILSPDLGFGFVNAERFVYQDNFLEKIIHFVHRSYFDDKYRLNHEERRIFIELTYLEIEKALINHIQPDSVNFSCKDGIDRAGGGTALYYFDLYLKNKTDFSENEIQNLEAILFAPALLVKKRAIIKNRFDRFISAAKHISRITS